MEKEWKKLIDEVENNRSYSSEPHFKFIPQFGIISSA